MTGKLLLLLSGLCIFGVIAVWLMLYVTPFGIGIWLDSLHYASAAESFVNGLGFVRESGCGSFKPMTHYPPFYSFILAIFSPIGLGPVRAARVVSALSFGLAVSLSGFAIYRINEKPLFALLGAGLILISPITLKTFSWALSEPLFIPLFLVGFLLLSFYFDKPSLLYLVGAGAFLGLAFLTRYVGITFIISAAIMLIINRCIDNKRKILDMTILGILSLGPVSLWILRNLIRMGTAADRYFDWHPPGTEAWFSLINTILGWFLPKTWISGREFTWLIVFVSIGTLWLVISLYSGWKTRKLIWRSPSLELLFVMSILIYMFFLGLSLTFFDPNTALNDRILIPVYIQLIILLVAQVGKGIKNRHIFLQAGILIGLGLFLVWQIQSGYKVIQDLRNDGQGYASSIWRSAMIVKKLKEFQPRLIYTNDITAIYFLSGIPACSIPVRNDDAALKVMREKLGQHNTALVIFGRNVSGEFVPYEEIISGLKPIYDQSDGVIMSSSGIP
jgi:hypothetical protein